LLCQTEDESRKRKKDDVDADDATAADKKFRDDVERDAVVEMPDS